MKTVAALYIDPKGPYPSMPDVEAWDQARDARQYAGPHPVVAHPPCGPWGMLRHQSREDVKDCAPIAVEQVRAFGGVLEHPAGSKLWQACRLALPEGLPDGYGFTIEVCQVAWGHVARKRTWLYFVGVSPLAVESGRLRGGTPTHWVSGNHTPGPKGAPGHIRICSKQQRRRTPQRFADWLVDIARQVA